MLRRRTGRPCLTSVLQPFSLCLTHHQQRHLHSIALVAAGTGRTVCCRHQKGAGRLAPVLGALFRHRLPRGQVLVPTNAARGHPDVVCHVGPRGEANGAPAARPLGRSCRLASMQMCASNTALAEVSNMVPAWAARMWTFRCWPAAPEDASDDASGGTSCAAIPQRPRRSRPRSRRAAAGLSSARRHGTTVPDYQTRTKRNIDSCAAMP